MRYRYAASLSLFALLLLAHAVAAQQNGTSPPAQPAPKTSQPPVDCQPQPDCRVISSPLNPSNPGPGIHPQGMNPVGSSISPDHLGITKQ